MVHLLAAKWALKSAAFLGLHRLLAEIAVVE
jgi:hypothetical protein